MNTPLGKCCIPEAARLQSRCPAQFLERWCADCRTRQTWANHLRTGRTKGPSPTACACPELVGERQVLGLDNVCIRTYSASVYLQRNHRFQIEDLPLLPKLTCWSFDSWPESLFTVAIRPANKSNFLSHRRLKIVRSNVIGSLRLTELMLSTWMKMPEAKKSIEMECLRDRDFSDAKAPRTGQGWLSGEVLVSSCRSRSSPTSA
jgi:hypothetical protein